MAKFNARNFKRFIDGNSLDLSLNNIEELPVNEIAVFSKITVVDLSCNLLKGLPEDFCLLTRITRIDLSKNRLVSLPSSFGQLVAIQELDLRSNQLHTLPPSFGQLRRLRWLDLKDNPLEGNLAQVAGQCLNELECQRCANEVTKHMRDVASCLERKRQLRLQNEREEEAARRRAESARLAEEREAKRIQKEDRRKLFEERKAAEKEAAIAASLAASKNTASTDENQKQISGDQETSADVSSNSSDGVCSSVCTWLTRLAMFTMLTVLFLCSLLLACDLHAGFKDQAFCSTLGKSLPSTLRPFYGQLRTRVGDLLR